MAQNPNEPDDKTNKPPKEFRPEIRTCPKCGAKGYAFVCDVRGCPVNGGMAN